MFCVVCGVRIRVSSGNFTVEGKLMNHNTLYYTYLSGRVGPVWGGGGSFLEGGECVMERSISVPRLF